MSGREEALVLYLAIHPCQNVFDVGWRRNVDGLAVGVNPAVDNPERKAVSSDVESGDQFATYDPAAIVGHTCSLHNERPLVASGVP